MAAAAINIRPEQPGDAAPIRVVHAAAFPTDAEARLVDALREHGELLVSLVAEQGGSVVGHVAFSPVTLDGDACGGVGLAPVAVLPDQQTRGIGRGLIDAGIQACRAAGYTLVVVLGEPCYYQRFGFTPAAQSGLESIYQAGDAFMALELAPGGLAEHAGLVRYSQAFDSL